jgi:2-amino-4-hydroxy-6-hydroxymethyldihydropteridine diphosphokinase
MPWHKAIEIKAPTSLPEYANIAAMKEQAFLLLGSNQGQPYEQLATARHHIAAQLGQVIAASSIYQTAAWGKTDQPDFLNQVLVLHTELDAHSLLQGMLAIEQAMGRQRLEYMGPRVIDIDLLAFGQAVIDEPGLQVPHPRIAARRFVLIPLQEVAPNWIHPLLGLTASSLLTVCPDSLNVNKFYPPQP